MSRVIGRDKFNALGQSFAPSDRGTEACPIGGKSLNRLKRRRATRSEWIPISIIDVLVSCHPGRAVGTKVIRLKPPHNSVFIRLKKLGGTSGDNNPMPRGAGGSGGPPVVQQHSSKQL